MACLDTWGIKQQQQLWKGHVMRRMWGIGRDRHVMPYSDSGAPAGWTHSCPLFGDCTAAAGAALVLEWVAGPFHTSAAAATPGCCRAHPCMCWRV